MKTIISLFVLLAVLNFSLFSQEKTYFQQAVNYDLDVTLNDVDHTLTGAIKIEYTNNSPDELDFIYFHLWPNAYKNTQTAFARQKVENGSTRFYFSDKKDRGEIRDLDFNINGKTTTWEYDQQNVDIAIVRLPKPLRSGEKIIIETPFILQIPKSFSRLGHVEQSYQLTQWYPKPAVYDAEGWHPMPYLDQGEFYSEFGDFDVTITLPSNYVVGATGELQTASEIEFLNQKATQGASMNFEETNENTAFPKSDATTKTLHYTAKNVHDFAWFADKRFHVLKSGVTLPSGKKVDTWAMFTDLEANLWKEAPTYLDRSVTFYSEKVGEYPWSHATAVQSALSAGAGMEYPMITVIGESGTARSLDIVITHEVGHNWFYGILATNERDYPWMDEGMNSYYEQRYTAKYYPGQDKLGDMLPGWMSNLLDADEVELGYAGYLLQARRHEEQHIHCHSAELTNVNYGLSGYTRPADVLWYLANYLGEDNFDNIMKSYYAKWSFKHPQPADFRAVFEDAVDKDLSWFFDDVLMTNKQLDYALTRTQGKVATIENRGEISAPYSISLLKGDKIVKTMWYKGFEGKKEVSLTTGDYDAAVIDAIKVIPDVNRKNNGQKRKPQLKFLGGIENEDKRTLYYTPLIGGNAYDKLTLGLGVYNVVIPAKNFELALAPMIGTGSGELVGTAGANYFVYPKKGVFKSIRMGLGVRSFHYNEYGGSDPAIDYLERYTRIVPSMNFELRKRTPRSPVSQNITIKYVRVLQENATFFRDTFPNSVAQYTGNKLNDWGVIQASYSYQNSNTINPFSLVASLEFMPDGVDANNPFDRDNTYAKLALEGTYRYVYQAGKGIDFRLFAGTFLYNANRDFGDFTFNMTRQGYQDNNFDDYYFGRSETEGIWSQQVQLTDGAFKTPLQRSDYGESNAFLFAVNFKADLPIKLPLNLPIKPYFDIGYFKNTAPSVTPEPGYELMLSGGLAIEFADGVAGLYLPIFSNERLSNALQSRGSGYFNRVGFTLNLNRMNPFELLRGLSL